MTTSWIRSRAPSLRSKLARCDLTVATLMNNSAATSLFDMARPTRTSTSRSRPVTPSRVHPAAGRARLVDLFAAEWIKFRSLRSTAVTLAALAALYLCLAYSGAQDGYQVWQSLPQHLRPVFDPAHVLVVWWSYDGGNRQLPRR